MGASIPSWARVGAKVVCVDDKAIDGGSFPLTKGRIYVIASVKGKWLRVTDDRNRVGGWHYSHFRPLIVRKTEAEDLAMFRNIAGATPEPDRQTYVRELLVEWEAEAGH